MNQELELKFNVTYEKYRIIKQFLENNAEKLVDKIQEDIYYSPLGFDFYDNGDRCLRMRNEGEKRILSYKRIHEECETERFIEEYETKVESFEMMDHILSALDFEKSIVVKKCRIEFRYDKKYIVALDNVEKLGYFIEIENTDEKDTVEKRNIDLWSVAKKFDLDMRMKNGEGYSNMLYRKLKKGK